MYERFTDRARKVMQLADRAARRWGHPDLRPAHVLYGLAEEGHGVAAVALGRLGVDLNALRQELEARWGPPAAPAPAGGLWESLGRLLSPASRLPLAPEASDLVGRSTGAARGLGHEYVGSEHLLLGLASGPAGEPVADLLAAAGATSARVEAEIRAVFGGPPG